MARITSSAAVRIGENIRAARIRRGFTQDQLAVATSTNSSNIRSYETGRSLLAVRSLVRIAEALEVDAGELLAEVTSEMLAPRARKAPDAGGGGVGRLDPHDQPVGERLRAVPVGSDKGALLSVVHEQSHVRPVGELDPAAGVRARGEERSAAAVVCGDTGELTDLCDRDRGTGSEILHLGDDECAGHVDPAVTRELRCQCVVDTEVPHPRGSKLFGSLVRDSVWEWLRWREHGHQRVRRGNASGAVRFGPGCVEYLFSGALKTIRIGPSERYLSDRQDGGDYQRTDARRFSESGEILHGEREHADDDGVNDPPQPHKRWANDSRVAIMDLPRHGVSKCFLENLGCESRRRTAPDVTADGFGVKRLRGGTTVLH